MNIGPNKWKDDVRKKLCDDVIDLMDNDNSIVHFTQVAKHFNMTSHALHKVIEDYEDIREVFTKVKEELETRLVLGGLTNTFNAGFAKFLLSAKYSFVEKTAVSVIKTETLPEFGDD